MISEAEFIILLEDCADNLRGFFRRRGVGYADSDDLVQECLAVLWRRRHEVDPAKGRSFLFGVARNNLSAHWRKHAQNNARDDALSHAGEPTAPGPDRAVEALERTERLNDLFDTLPPRQREVMQLVYGSELILSEAARRMGVCRGTALSHHSRALKALATMIERNSDLF